MLNKTRTYVVRELLANALLGLDEVSLRFESDGLVLVATPRELVEVVVDLAREAQQNAGDEYPDNWNVGGAQLKLLDLLVDEVVDLRPSESAYRFPRVTWEVVA